MHILILVTRYGRNPGKYLKYYSAKHVAHAGE